MAHPEKILEPRVGLRAELRVLAMELPDRVEMQA